MPFTKLQKQFERRLQQLELQHFFVTQEFTYAVEKWDATPRGESVKVDGYWWVQVVLYRSAEYPIWAHRAFPLALADPDNPSESLDIDARTRRDWKAVEDCVCDLDALVRRQAEETCQGKQGDQDAA